MGVRSEDFFFFIMLVAVFGLPCHGEEVNVTMEQRGLFVVSAHIALGEADRKLDFTVEEGHVAYYLAQFQFPYLRSAITSHCYLLVISCATLLLILAGCVQRRCHLRYPVAQCAGFQALVAICAALMELQPQFCAQCICLLSPVFECTASYRSAYATCEPSSRYSCCRGDGKR